MPLRVTEGIPIPLPGLPKKPQDKPGATPTGETIPADPITFSPLEAFLIQRDAGPQAVKGKSRRLYFLS